MNQSLTLWQLDETYLTTMAEIEANEGELTPELEARLDQAIHALVKKQDGYIKVMDTLDAWEAQAKKWRDRMTEKIQAIQNHKDRLKNALIQHLHTIDATEFQGELGKVKLMQTVKVGAIDEALLPATYKEIITETKIDRRRLLQDLKLNPIPGAELETVEYLRIFVS